MTTILSVTPGAGTFAGFRYEGMTGGTGADEIRYTGSTAVVTPATGSGTGTATAGTTPTSLVVAAAGWTVNDLRGSFLRITGGGGSGEVRPILENSATAIAVHAISGLAAGSTFEVVTPATLIAADAGDATRCVTLADLAIPITLSWLKFTAATYYAVVATECHRIKFENCLFDLDTLIATVIAQNNRRITFKSCVVKSGGDIWMIDTAGRVDAQNMLLDNGAIRIDRTLAADVRAYARNCNATATKITQSNYAAVELDASSNNTTPLVLQSVASFEPVGAKLIGSGNTGYGISISRSGWYNLIGCTLTGGLGDIDFDGDLLTWANLGSSTYGVAVKHGATLVGESGENKAIMYKSASYLASVEIGGRLLTYGFFNMSEVTGLVATGTTATDALQLTQYVYNRVDTVAAGTGVKMTNGSVIPGVFAVIHNNGANTLTIYPYSGGTINGAASVTLAAGKRIMLMSSSNDGLSWVSIAPEV